MNNEERAQGKMKSEEEEKEIPHDDLIPDNFLNDTYLLPSFYLPENNFLMVDTHNGI